ncbi:MAG: hypothetical protein KAH23_05105 [Kiritimatiellae bacterium]|nr:hypothetical protein [Kiritimatiellia bacterium]
MKKNNNKAKSGQTIIFLAIAIVILTFMILWNFDLHKILHVKYITQNAGDSSATMASRWQGITLNLIGELNIMHAVAISTSNTTAMTEITNLQARLCYVGPMIAFMASQQAAKQNGAYVNEAFTTIIRDHANEVRYTYPTDMDVNGQILIPEPYPGCWSEYADMLDAIADNGVAAGPDNALFYGDSGQDHILMNPYFYDAIAARTWCWFFQNAMYELTSYINFYPCWWPDLPDIRYPHPMNSEIYGLHLTKRATTLNSFGFAGLTNFMVTPKLDPLDSNTVADVTATWYCYASDSWGPWESMSTSGADPFPSVGPLKQKYNYAGADAVVVIEAESERVTPGYDKTISKDRLRWNSAAKPFGYINNDEPPTAYTLVLPAFRDVRLIPLDASSLGGAGSFDIDWRIHITKHLRGYVDDNGNFLEGYVPDGLDAPAVDSSCWYCRQLETWEDEIGFRDAGIAWLEEHSNQCIPAPGGPGGRRGGGRRRGH